MKLLLLATLAALVLTAAPAAAQTRLATEGAYPPFNYVDDNGNVGGFDIDVGNEICRRANLTCTWQVNAWDTILPNLIAGNYDAIIADLTITPDRKKTIDFTSEYFPPDPSAWLARTGVAVDYKAITGLRLGAQSGTVQSIHLDDKFKAGNTIVKYDTTDQAVAGLRAGNVDLVLLEGSTAGEIVAGSAGALVSDGPRIPIGLGAGIGLRQGDNELERQFNEALKSMKEDGWLDDRIRQYFPTLGPGPFYKYD